MNINPVVRINRDFSTIDDEAQFVFGEHQYLYDNNGKKYIDYCGGIWNIPFGYTNPIIVEKITAQLNKLPFCNLITHVSDIQYNYAVRLNKILGTNSILYTCSGSEAIEAAIKVCRKYQKLKNKSARSVSAFSLSYHGTSYGAMSISGIDKNAASDYNPLLGGIEWIQLPHDLENIQLWMESIESHFEKNADRLAGVIIEPILGSGGIINVPLCVIQKIKENCDRHDIVLVFDEVTTGFGRTGVPFIYQKYDIMPDLICLSKGITNGYLPLGVLAFSNKITEVFAANHAGLEHFSTQGGNLLSVAAADAVLDIMQNYDEFEVLKKGEHFKRQLSEYLSPYPDVKIRGFGMMLAISFPKQTKEYLLLEIWRKLESHGILVYVFNNPGYNIGFSMFPPFTSSPDELSKSAKIITQTLKRYPEILFRKGNMNNENQTSDN